MSPMENPTVTIFFIVREKLQLSHAHALKIHPNVAELIKRIKPLGTVLPLYRTGVSLLSRERFLFI